MPIELTLVQKIAVWALPVLFAITVHEASHGYVARLLGDRTAEAAGRLSLNPLRHIDPVGTVLVPVLLLALGGFLFGWAKPVPVNFRNLRHPRRDMAVVAIAGPLSNFAMAIGWALLLKIALGAAVTEGLWLGLRYMAVAGILINLVLMVLNLLPLPPLDGGRVLNGLVSEPVARRLDRIEPYGLVILVVLMATGVLGQILQWPLALAQFVVLSLVGLPAASNF
ncbi:site-2 protease family protein [Fontimonas sp. SYSU GA230001]|uniref:site-2 protease family protein n=1 Tax=Fontimonas sp. SYSU GA230001 TaxID=3142450 RepID=UPI0032B45412